ncbi:MAG: tripartite tricarboxylate transporter substrate binding protein [Alcaligenaceae bacterium]|nr:tripartite tricarboxylate transporter substrate binding protein [Alcaligenaceae bacterium]
MIEQILKKSLKAVSLTTIACACVGGASANATRPAEFPDKPITIVVPFGPGSGSDVYARYFGDKLSKKINQPVIVENKPGGGGAVAALAVYGKPADGLTILLGSNSPMAVVIVPNDSPIKNVKDLVSRGKQQPLLNMGTYSTGYELGVAGFIKEAGFNWQVVPYKGLSQTTSDVIGKQLDVAVIDTPGTTKIIAGGQVRAVAVTGTLRHPELPDVPTLKEQGFRNAVHYSWTSLWLKAGTPQSTQEYLSKKLIEVMSEDSSKEFVANNSGEIMPLVPEELRKFQIEEIERF